MGNQSCYGVSLLPRHHTSCPCINPFLQVVPRHHVDVFDGGCFVTRYNLDVVVEKYVSDPILHFLHKLLSADGALLRGHVEIVSG